MPAIGILHNSFPGRDQDGRPRLHTELLGEPARCMHIGDHESGICELFCAAHESSTKFLVRTCADRLAHDGRHTIASAPPGRERIDWKLIANLPLRSRKDAVEKLVDKLIPGNPAKRRREAALSCYLTKIARLGGYLARTKDPPPTMAREMER